MGIARGGDYGYWHDLSFSGRSVGATIDLANSDIA